ncbi:NADPH:quinone reductase [Brevibacterium jeotgali]|uniref:NADPH:quinone reductase n=2 Tax=Brevibacterium jeotgali TaxID=1262550 RepID=A0A2H1L6S1_9MICO|nr:NADPH:quinone reductase-like Zn-dependent oxidoreductase [Brevibacterium jeotgali]SMY12450.1 NADPH:quinone reductase [Brevibacterium jeotgali]
MRAVVQRGYGPPAEVLRVRDVCRPAPGEGEVLVRVRAASVHPDVWHVVAGLPRVLRLMGSGLRRPSPAVPGTDVAGTIAAVGAGVHQFAAGDEVFGETTAGMQWRNGGAYAEYVVAQADGLATKPSDTTFEQAATVPTAGLIALLNLPDLETWEPGRRVLVIGAAGGVGAIAVQLARTAGAQVTGVDHSSKLDLLRGLGASRVVDYTQDDVTQGGESYDLVFDVAGVRPYAAYRPILTARGRYVVIGHDHFGARGRRLLGSVPRMIGLMARSFVDPRLPRPTAAPGRRESMARLQELLADGRLTPVVDRTFQLEQAGEAIGHLASGAARGRVVVVP